MGGRSSIWSRSYWRPGPQGAPRTKVLPFSAGRELLEADIVFSRNYRSHESGLGIPGPATATTHGKISRLIEQLPSFVGLNLIRIITEPSNIQFRPQAHFSIVTQGRDEGRLFGARCFPRVTVLATVVDTKHSSRSFST